MESQTTSWKSYGRPRLHWRKQSGGAFSASAIHSRYASSTFAACLARLAFSAWKPGVRHTNTHCSSSVINAAVAEGGVAFVGLLDPALQVSDALYPAIRGIVADAVAQRSERCQGDVGLPLWRRSTWSGAGPAGNVAQRSGFGCLDWGA